MAQPLQVKQKVSRKNQKYWNGYFEPSGSQANKSESRGWPPNRFFLTPILTISLSLDHKENFGWQYSPNLDPLYDYLPHPIPSSYIPENVMEYIRAEDEIWEGTLSVPGFKENAITYYRSMLSLARRLTRIFALALDLDESYFDSLTTFPGADLAFNYYPPVPSDVGKVKENEAMAHDVGLGSHTDLQCFTLLWQDMIGGLLVLSRGGEWIKATPIEGTIVVNIGDFLMRMTNDKWQSTVHRVEVNKTSEPRVSMPLFFGWLTLRLYLILWLTFLGFNFNELIGVLPSCTNDSEPPKYEPLRIGDVRLKHPKTALELQY
jgi:isopenicillin N synthase-like dioxygenase